MESLGGAGSWGQWSNIRNSDNSRSHFGHVYNTVNHGLSDPKATEEEVKTKFIIEKMYYPEIEHREKQIDDSAQHTFDWAFDDKSGPLRNWLTSGNSMFWVSGKPGSGKSTFMKFLARHPETERLLGEWSEGKILIVTAHYFWYAGSRSTLEKSREGLYRSLLYQIIISLPEVIPVVLPDRWRSCKKPAYRQSEWTVQELLKGLRLLTNVAETAFVLFVDGLDECYPPSEHAVLLTELEELNTLKTVKICVSSRPWKPFDSRLGALDSRLTMQSLTYGDMETHITTELLDATRDAGMDLEPLDLEPLEELQNDTEVLNDLASHIAGRSQGVFLWVHLILKDLREEILAGKEIHELREFVDEVPSGLLDYYKEGIWKRIGWRRERQVAMAFRIATVLAPATEMSYCPTDFLSFLHFWYMQQYQQREFEDSQFAVLAPIQRLSGAEIKPMVKKTRAFLGQVCRDLIQVEDENPKWQVAWPRIEFLHRSVLDFLSEPETQGWIEKSVPRHFYKAGFFYELNLLRLKLIRPRCDVEHSEEDLYDSLEFMAGQFDEGEYGRPELSGPFDKLPKFRAGIRGLTIDVVSQYQALAIHHLRARDGDGYYWSHGSEGSLHNVGGILTHITRLRHSHLTYFVESFTSFGLEKLVREIAIRCPSTFSRAFEQVIFNTIIAYLPHYFNPYVSTDFVKRLLDMGLLCSIKSWHALLQAWSNCQEEPVRSRIWRIADVLLLSGVKMNGELCVSHPFYEACAESNKVSADCVFTTIVDLLRVLVPSGHLSELSHLLTTYNDISWLLSLGKERRAKCCLLYRDGRKAHLEAITTLSSENLAKFELEYAEWIFQHEELRLNAFELSSGCFHPPTETICGNCGIDVRTQGCLNWICLSCLEYDYCTFCVPLVRDKHVGEFQCSEISIGALAAGRDDILEAIRNLGDVFDVAIETHETTKDMSRDEAIALVYSIVEKTMTGERKHQYLVDDSIKCQVR